MFTVAKNNYLKTLCLIALVSISLLLSIANQAIGYYDEIEEQDGAMDSSGEVPARIREVERAIIQPLSERLPCFIEFNEPPAAAQFNDYPISASQYAQAKIYADNLMVQHQQYILEINSQIPGFANRQRRDFVLTLNGITVQLSQTEQEQIEQLPFVRQVYELSTSKLLLQESVPHIQVPSVWQQGYDGTGIKIGVIDSGTDYTRPDFALNGEPEGCFGPGCKVEGGYDFYSDNPIPMDDLGHGTHVAGIIAGNTMSGNGNPITGVAPGSTLYSYKACGYEPGHEGDYRYYFCPDGDIIAALHTAADPNGDNNMEDHLDVISISLGRPSNDPNDPLAQELNNNVNIGMVAVAAAGNSGRGTGEGGYYNYIFAPGTSKRAITVGASHDINDVLANFSVKGPLSDGAIKPDVLAPGVDICSALAGNFVLNGSPCIPTVDDEHIELEGTSMAAPHVSGVAALLLQQHPDWNPEQIKYAIRNSAVDAEETNYNVFQQGHGRADALLASQEISPVIVTLNKISESDESVEFEAIVRSYHDTTPHTYQYTYDVGYMENLENPQQWLEQLHQIGDVLLNPNEPSTLTFPVIDKTQLLSDGNYLVRIQISGDDQESLDYYSFRVKNITIVAPFNGDVYQYGFNINGTIRIPQGYRYTFDYSSYEEPENWSSTGIQLTDEGLHGIVAGTLGSFDPADVPELTTNFYRFRVNIYHEQDPEPIRSQQFAFIRIAVQEIRPGFPVRILGNAELFLIDDIISLGIDDVDGDGLDEISFLHHNVDGTPSSVYMVRNDGTQDIISTSDNYWEVNKLSFLLADVNEDTLNDFFYSKYGVGTGSRILVQEHTGDVIEQVEFPDIPTVVVSYSGYSVKADLNHDGTEEVISVFEHDPYQQSLYVTDIHGTVVAGNWPQLRSFCSWVMLGDSPLISSPVIGNFDDDPDDEIALTTDSLEYCQTGIREGTLSIFNMDGSFVSPSLSIPGSHGITIPASADFDSDGEDDIVINTRHGIYVYRSATGQLENWLSDVNFKLSSPAIGDVNNDGYLEIVVNNFGTPTTVYVLSSDGTILYSWENSSLDWTGPILADVNGDNYLDVVYESSSTYLSNIEGNYFSMVQARSVINDFGEDLPGFPKILEYTWPQAKNIKDIDGDGLMELVTTSHGEIRLWWGSPNNGPDEFRNVVLRKSIFAWDLDVSESSLQHIWPTARGGFDRQGRYNGLSAPINFQAHREGINIAFSWQLARPFEYLSGYIVQYGWSQPDFSDAISFNVPLGRTSISTKNNRRYGHAVPARVGSYSGDGHIMWSPVKTVCVPGPMFFICPDEDNRFITATEVGNTTISPDAEGQHITPYHPDVNSSYPTQE